MEGTPNAKALGRSVGGSFEGLQEGQYGWDLVKEGKVGDEVRGEGEGSSSLGPCRHLSCLFVKVRKANIEGAEQR